MKKMLILINPNISQLALQPGVNRCKLLSSKHFDILYRDCTQAR